MDACYPEAHKKTVCAVCARYKPDRPLPVDVRQFPVIDATTVNWPGGICPMFADKQIGRHYTDDDK